MELFFDGKTVSIFGKNINGYNQIDVPGTVDQLIRDPEIGPWDLRYRVLTFCSQSSYDVLIAGVKEAEYLGRGVIDGQCNASTWPSADFDTDWQLWVEGGEQNPFRVNWVITSKTMNSGPQYTLRIKSWKTGVRAGTVCIRIRPADRSQKELDAYDLIESRRIAARRHRKEENNDTNHRQVHTV